MAEIHRIGGNVLPDEPSAELIETLQTLLDSAKRGELRAIAYTTVRGVKNDTIGTGWDGVAGSRYPLAGGILMLQQRYARGLLEGD